MTLINLPTVGGTLRKSRILLERDSGSEPAAQRDVTARDGTVGQQVLPSSLLLVNRGPSDDCTHGDFFIFSQLLSHKQPGSFYPLDQNAAKFRFWYFNSCQLEQSGCSPGFTLSSPTSFSHHLTDKRGPLGARTALRALLRCWV